MGFKLLLIFLFLEYTRPGHMFDIEAITSVHTFLGLGLFLYSIGMRSVVPNGVVWSNPTTKWLTALLVMTAITILTALASSENAYNSTIQALGNLFIYLSVVRLVQNYTDLKKVIGMIGLIHVFIIFNSADIILQPEVRNYMNAAPYFGDGNDFALSLVTIFPLILFLWMVETNKKKRIFYAFIMLVCVLATVGTQSRGATLGLAGILFYMWWNGGQKFVGAFAVMFLLLIVMAFAPPEYFTRMNSIQDFESDGSAQGRINAWKRSVDLVIQYPLTGVGANNFGFFNKNKAPHSIFFKAMAELGLPGIIILLGYLIGNFKRNSRLKKELGKDPPGQSLEMRKFMICLNASILGFSICGAFLNVLFAPHIYMLGAIMFSAHFVYKNEIAKQNESVLGAEEKEKKLIKKRINYYE